jgi:octaprenyl-diphosphate synthase
MDNLYTIKKPVEKELIDFEKHFRINLKSPVPLLDIITNYILRRKGKQIRPLFVFLSAKLCGEVNKSTFTAATLIELLHTATLIHDDVVDEAYERRNYFSINAIWKSKVAVLVGDYLLARGLLTSITENEYELLKIVSEAVQEMSEGELLQIQSSRKTIINEVNYYEIIKKKTASLIGACTLSGAKSAKANEKVSSIMKEFGISAGMAFQIKDDLFDYQVNGIMGKPVGNDIKEKKFTLPLIIALQNSNLSDKKRILKLMNDNNNSLSKISEIVKYVTEENGIYEAEKIMNSFKNKALDVLSYFPDSDTKNSIFSLVNYIIVRDN